MTSKPPAAVLTIAGSDSGGGAGVQADARTIHALGGFACMAITAITAQNTRGVCSWHPESPRVIAAQIAAVLDPEGGLSVRAIKTGLLPGAGAVRAIARQLEAVPGVPLVIDPVIGSTSGVQFLDARGLRSLRELLAPRATLLTPNWPEAAALSGRSLSSFAEAEDAARDLMEKHGCAVLVKGGHGPGAICRDCLVTRDGKVRWFESRRCRTPNTHGTGCVLSAAIATGLAHDRPLPRAVAEARAFLHRSLVQHARTRWSGSGPAFPG